MDLVPSYYIVTILQTHICFQNYHSTKNLQSMFYFSELLFFKCDAVDFNLHVSSRKPNYHKDIDGL